MRSKKKDTQTSLNETQFKALIENAHDGIVLYDNKGGIKYVSKSAYKMLGYRTPDVMKKRGSDFLHPDDVEDARLAFSQLVSKPAKSTTLFQRIRHKDGHYIWAESRLTNFLHIPEIHGVVSNFRDITEKKLAEERIKETRDLLETVNRNLTEGIFMGILGKRYLYTNDAFLKLTGYRSFGELEKIKPADIFADNNHRKKIVSQLKKTVTLEGVETTFLKKNGDSFWGVMNVRLLKHEGKNDYFVGTVRDITKEKKAELELIESRNFFNNIINTVASPIYVKDEKYRWKMFNDKFCELIGKSRTALTGKSEKDFFSPKEVRQFRQTDDEVLKTGRTVVTEEEITIVPGKPQSLLTVKSRYVNEKGEKFVICSATDITHLKKTEEKIKHLHENLQGVLESSRESIFSVDNKLRYTAFNRHHKKMMKLLFNADIQTGENKIEYLKSFPDARWVKAELQKALAGEHFVTNHVQEYPHYKGYIQTIYNPIRDDKNRVKGVAVFVQDITERKRFEEIISSINANLRAVMESTSDRILALDKDLRYMMFNHAHAESMKHLFGKEIRVGDNLLDVLPGDVGAMVQEKTDRAIRGEQFITETELPKGITIETSYNPIYDSRGEVTGVALFIRDVTERKHLEEQLKKLNRELTEQNVQLATQEEELKLTLDELSERNFELDQLMYKTSHDLRSPLSSIMGLINLAHIDPDAASHREYFAKIEGRVKKLDEFIRSMLDVARVNRTDLHSDTINLPVMIQSSINELEYLDNFSKMRTEINILGNHVPFRSDNLRLKIIISNIISNAYKYQNPERESLLRISVDVTPDMAKVTFEDNGIGIKQEHIDKIFNMFYRATDRSQGSGLGMYIVKQAVEKLEGKISIESKYGHGTRIEIQLPNTLRA